MKSRLIIADDHPVILQGLRELIAMTPDLEVVAEASNGVDAEHLGRTVVADLLLLDITMPQRNGVAVLESLRADGIALLVLFFTMTDAHQYSAYVQHIGAQGIVEKNAESGELLHSIRQVLGGGNCFPAARRVFNATAKVANAGVLSARENQVMKGLMRGDSQVSIAASLGISNASVNTYRRRILDKFGVDNTAELIKVRSRGNI